MEYIQHIILALVLVLAFSISIQAEAVEVQFSLDIKGGQAVRERLKIDLETVKAAASDAKLDLGTRVNEISGKIDTIPNELPEDFRTIMPFNDLQAQIFALNATVLQSKGLSALTVWTQNRWDPLSPTQAPLKKPGAIKINVDMLGNEYRSEAFNLTNATDKPINAQIVINGLKGGDNPDWISVRDVLFTDTYIHYPIASALPDAKRLSGGYEINIPAGMTRQVWLVFYSKGIKAGTHKGEITLKADGLKPINIPLKVHVYPFELPAKSSIAIGGWDYTDGEVSAFDAKLVDQKTYIEFLRDYGVNTPWGGSFLFKGCEFDADGRMTVPPDFTVWNNWIAKWKDAHNYAVFLGVGNNLNGEPMGTPRFKRMVAEWVTSVVTHARSQGIQPKNLFLLLVDEPHTTDQIITTIEWATAIKAAQPDVIIWSDPAFEDTTMADPNFFKVVDVLCPLITRFVGSPQSYRDLFVNQQKAGRELMFYACVNGKHLDPISYHRAQFWLGIKYHATGSFYWAFGDEGGAPSSFKTYSSPGHMFSPFFIDPQMGIVDGKHMQAIREGAEDFEYFQLLQKKVDMLESLGVKSSVLIAARKLLVEGPDRVFQEITVPNISWWTPKDRSTMDKVRLDVIRMLEKLQAINER